MPNLLLYIINRFIFQWLLFNWWLDDNCERWCRVAFFFAFEIIFAQADLLNIPQYQSWTHSISLINTTQETELIVNNTRVRIA